MNHEKNLQKFRDQEQDIIERFEGDIERFKRLKGLDGLAGQQTRDSSESLAAQAVPGEADDLADRQEQGSAG